MYVAISVVSKHINIGGACFTLHLLFCRVNFFFSLLSKSLPILEICEVQSVCVDADSEHVYQSKFMISNTAVAILFSINGHILFDVLSLYRIATLILKINQF